MFPPNRTPHAQKLCKSADAIAMFMAEAMTAVIVVNFIVEVNLVSN